LPIVIRLSFDKQVTTIKTTIILGYKRKKSLPLIIIATHILPCWTKRRSSSTSLHYLSPL